MRDIGLKEGPVRSGFEPEDRYQEGAVGILMSERTKPGDRWAGRSRAIVRRARHMKRERAWNILRVPIQDSDKVEMSKAFEKALLHEVLDLIPYAKRQEVLKALLSKDGRKIRRAGRIVRENLPRPLTF